MQDYDRQRDLEKALGLTRGCVLCPDPAAERRFVVFGSGPPDADVMIIGEGPGEDEDASGNPFVGKAGNMLNHLLRLAGLERSRLYITNLVCCRCTAETVEHGKTRKKDRQPTRAEMNNCWPRLERQIYAVDPVVIVAAGKPSALRLTKAPNLKAAMRDVHTLSLAGKTTTIEYPVLAIYHPSFLLRRGNNADLFQATVDQLRHLKRTLEAFKELGRDRPWKEKVA